MFIEDTLLKEILVSPPAVVALIASSFAAFKWIQREYRNKSVTEVFITDMATNHLPHIYAALRALCHAGNLEVVEPPGIKFISKKDFEGN